MTRHLIRLIWNRKRQNFLLTVEMFFSFLTLFGVVLVAAHYINNSRQPLGYDIDRVWSMSVDRKESDQDPAVKARHRQTYRTGAHGALATCRKSRRSARPSRAPMPTRTGAAAHASPAAGSVDYGVNSVTDSYAELLKIPIVEGRWFSREDDAATWTPVVVNRRLAQRDLR